MNFVYRPREITWKFNKLVRYSYAAFFELGGVANLLDPKVGYDALSLIVLFVLATLSKWLGINIGSVKKPETYGLDVIITDRFSGESLERIHFDEWHPGDYPSNVEFQVVDRREK